MRLAARPQQAMSRRWPSRPLTPGGTDWRPSIKVVPQLRTIVICTDFYDPSDALPHLADADFVFVEANHDVQLLREYFNPNSRFHLSNGETARLLVQAIRAGGRARTRRHGSEPRCRS